MRSWLAACVAALGLVACGMASENGSLGQTTGHDGGGADTRGGDDDSARAAGTQAGATTCSLGPDACLREVTCRASCDGPITAQGCCPCVDGEIDDVSCSEDAGAPADAGTD